MTQSSEPNQRTNDATCWPNPWAEWAGSRSSRAHQTEAGSSDFLAVGPALRIFSAQRGGDAENAWTENDGQKLRGLENVGLENDGQTFSKLWAHYVCIFDVYLAKYRKTLLELPVD